MKTDNPNRWQRGEDGKYQPTPPYREGEVVECEGCRRPVTVTKYTELHQFAMDDCRACDDAYEAYLRRSTHGDQ